MNEKTEASVILMNQIEMMKEFNAYEMNANFDVEYDGDIYNVIIAIERCQKVSE